MSSLADRTLPLSLRNQIARLIDLNNKIRSDGKKVASSQTQQCRASNIYLMVAQLWELGYRIKKPESLCEKHVQALVSYWDKQGNSASTINCRLTDLRTFASWMGKREIVKDILTYLPKERVARTTIAKRDKSWTANGVDPEVIIEKAKHIDERFAVMLLLMRAFGLRVKEVIELRPLRALTSQGDCLELFEGTKGGRYRKIDITKPDQRLAMEEARRVARQHSSGRMRWPDCTWKRSRSRFYWYMKKLGATLEDLGITAHGLRHEYLQGEYVYETGLLPPIKGGALGQIDWETHQMASITVARRAGHGRPDVSPSYYGTYGHQLRNTKVKVTFGGLATSLPA